jgi:hypothetical protein
VHEQDVAGLISFSWKSTRPSFVEPFHSTSGDNPHLRHDARTVSL